MQSTPLSARQDLARTRWSALGGRLRTVTPEAVGRALLTLACLGLLAWVIGAAGSAVRPFIIGGIVAYAVLPLANRLSRFMPRILAALLAELVALAILVGIVVVVVPPLLRGFGQVLQRLPTPAEVEAALVAFEAQVGVLPEPLSTIVLEVAQEVVAGIGTFLDSLVSGVADFVTAQILGLAGTLSFVFGLLVVPVWVLTVVRDEGAIKRSTRRLIAPVIRADVVALVRIVDRALAAFLRVRVLMAIATGVLVYLGLALAERLGLGVFPYAVTAGVLLGTLQLIPEIGFLLGFLPILLVLAIAGPVDASILVLVYVLAARASGMSVGTRLSRGVLDVHPGLLIPAIVVLSGFGPLWLLAAAPIVVVLRDSVRYLAGRLAEPPKPPGQLPGERALRSRAATAAAAVPSVYQSAGTTAVPSVYRTASERSTP